METTTISPDILELVTFTLKNEEYAVDILNVQEINRITEITKIPNSPDYVEGVINLRGKVIPVINLRKKLGFEAKAADGNSRIIIAEINGITKGLIVDSVSEVLRIHSDKVEPPPPLSHEVNHKHIKGVANLDNRLITLIDLDKSVNKHDVPETD